MTRFFVVGRAARPLWRLPLLLVLAGFLAGLAAWPAAADPATLAGETFQGGGLQTLESGACNTSGSSTFTFAVEGTAAGPVAGTFAETISVTLASPAGPVTDVHGSFEINGGAVTGDMSLPAEVPGSCFSFPEEDPYAVVMVGAVDPPTLPFQLRYTVTSPFTEQGELTVTELVAVAGNSAFGSPLIFFSANAFVPDTGFSWTGLFRPIENTDADGNYILNVVKAGQGVPVKFSLGGDQGLAIFADGYPQSSQIACDTGADLNTDSETVAAGSSSLSYDQLTNAYSYIWKTDKTWAGSCRQLDIKLTDGTTHSAQFQFK